MKKYFIPEGKVEAERKDSQEINMQICIDRYAFAHSAIPLFRTW